MVDCLMMGLGVDEARALSYWEFSALRHVWNERHKTSDDKGDGEPVAPPDVDTVRAAQAELAALGISGRAG